MKKGGWWRGETKRVDTQRVVGEQDPQKPQLKMRCLSTQYFDVIVAKQKNSKVTKKTAKTIQNVI